MYAIPCKVIVDNILLFVYLLAVGLLVPVMVHYLVSPESVPIMVLVGAKTLGHGVVLLLCVRFLYALWSSEV